MHENIAPYTSPSYQRRVREKLHEYNVGNPQGTRGVAYIAREIGVKPSLLSDFLEYGVDINYKSLCTIERFLKENGIAIKDNDGNNK
jgi:hypothetical protein